MLRAMKKLILALLYGVCATLIIANALLVLGVLRLVPFSLVGLPLGMAVMSLRWRRVRPKMVKG